MLRFSECYESLGFPKAKQWLASTAVFERDVERTGQRYTGCHAARSDGYDSNSARGNCDWRIIEESVPGANSRWLGTDTVMVEFAIRFCMMM